MTTQVKDLLIVNHDIDNINSMSYGMFNNKSFFGIPSKVLKSGICKYYRREYFDKFEWCCIEMMLFGIKSRGLVSNVLNRLRILVMEEITCNDENLVNAIMVLNSIDDELELIEKIKRVKQFCDIVRNSKRARICSYVNNWWKYNPVEYDDILIPDKVLKYKKGGDSDELLILGERLISHIENRDERLFHIYNSLYTYEKSGRRYRRSDGIYLYWEIIEDYLCRNIDNIDNINNNKIIFEFGLNMFNRKSMKERKAFGIWIGLMVLHRDTLNYKNEVIDYKDKNKENEFDIEKYLLTRKSITINEDFVVNDWHVNKKYGKKKFGEVGSFVENEDTSLLGDNFDKYKNFYMEKKSEEDSLQKPKRIKKVPKCDKSPKLS